MEPTTPTETIDIIPEDLTARELTIARRIALGELRRDIARDLGVTGKTVDTHRRHILKKLNLRGAVDLARYAIRRGWVAL